MTGRRYWSCLVFGRGARTIVTLRGNLLPFRCVKIIEIGFGHGFRAFTFRILVHQGHRRLGENADGRPDNFKVTLG